MSGAESRHVLVCGHRAFAARGLRDLLEAQGHQVTEFSRGPIGRKCGSFTGPVTELHCNPHLEAGYDAVVNFIVLRHESVQRNLDYFESLSKMCRDRNVRHLIVDERLPGLGARHYRDCIDQDRPALLRPIRCIQGGRGTVLA